MTFNERFLAALYVSEVWYGGFTIETMPMRYRLHCRARAVVLFDRVMTERIQLKL